MRFKSIFFTIVLTLGANSVYATEITAASLTIPGGTNASAVWNAPFSQTYKVFVFIPTTATASSISYRVYPKGKVADSICFQPVPNSSCSVISVDQKSNKGKWVQLMLNNDPSTVWSFVKTVGYVTVKSNELASTNRLGIAGIRFEPPAMGYSKIANDGTLLESTASLGTGTKDWACTLDNVTGLVWEVKTDDGGLRDKDNYYSWYNPKDANYTGSQNQASCTGGASCDTDGYAKSVNLKKLCGYTDWHTPTIGQLGSLVNNNYSPTIDPSYFPNTLVSIFWSSTPVADNKYNAWFENFASGNVSQNYKSSGYPVRLVHGK